MNMGEIEFIEEIEDSLKKGTYEDLLCGSELKLKNLFESAESSEDGSYAGCKSGLCDGAYGR